MKFLTSLMHALLSYGSYWLMMRADSKFYLFTIGTFFAAFALVTIISPRNTNH